MTELEIKEELEKMVRWRSVSGPDVLKLYKIYRLIYPQDKSHLCTKCSTVIRNKFNQVKAYYKKNYEN